MYFRYKIYLQYKLYLGYTSMHAGVVAYPVPLTSYVYPQYNEGTVYTPCILYTDSIYTVGI
jgi:hypothetical protein